MFKQRFLFNIEIMIIYIKHQHKNKVDQMIEILLIIIGNYISKNEFHSIELTYLTKIFGFLMNCLIFNYQNFSCVKISARLFLDRISHIIPYMRNFETVDEIPKEMIISIC